MDVVRLVLTPGSVHYLVCALLVCVAVGARRSTGTRQLALLLASWLFYAGWGVGFLAVLIASSLLNYLLGISLKRHLTAARLWMSVAVNVALLAFFKYGTPALVGQPQLAFLSQLVRPIGISFWTLQALSYLFDIYREEELDPSLLEFCLYMAFWPTVLAGPICRLSSLLTQFRQPIRPSSDDVSVGATRVLQGLFMKMVLAEILGTGWVPGTGVNAGFDRIGGTWTGPDVWFLAIGFGFQLFFDFAGYSHIVIGATRLLGVRLEENFDRPYLSLTPAAFWTRWHMSFSSWIRDYVFMQLSSIRRGRWWVYCSLSLSMVVCGLWHEASLTFIAWGAYHGLLLVSHRLVQQAKRSFSFQLSPALDRVLSYTSTFSLVSVGWLFFRARTLSQAGLMFSALLAPGSYRRLALPHPFYVTTAAIVLGWVVFHVAEALLARWRAAYEENLRAGADSLTVTQAAREPVSLNVLALELVNTAAVDKWWWLAPMMIVIALFTGVAINDLKPAAPATPFMYTLF